MKELRYKFSSLEKILEDVLNKEEVNLYGFTIEEEKIHLVCLLKSGDLEYGTFYKGDWTFAQIGKFDTKSNIYIIN